MVAATVSRPQSAGAQYLDSKDALCTLQLPWPAHEPAQTYKDILDALQGLDVALDLVVGRVTKRVADEGQKLAALTGRIDAAAKRVSAVAGNRQAIVLFSAARFPGGKDAAKVKYFDRLFYDEGHLQRRAAEQLEIPEEPFVESLEEMAERRKKLDLSLRVDMDTIELYKADLELKPELATNNPSMPPPPDVLAPLPPSVSSVSSVLLFNTPYNVYADHTPFDNLSGEAAPRKDVRAKEEELAQAPQTVLFGDQLPEVERIEYSYKPVLGAVPELDVPSMLPNLSNVANLNWTALDLPSIAPSTLNAMLLPTLSTLPSAS
jgi:WAS family protein 1